ncbi:MAG: FG-GAP-like repeat-containing protein [Bacteroidota bacterium]
MEPVAATIVVKDVSENNNLKVCGNVPFSYERYDNSNHLFVSVNFNVDDLVASGCNEFNDYEYTRKDKVDITITYKVVGNIGPAEQRLDYYNDFYLKKEKNGSTRYGCIKQNAITEASVYVYGYHFESNFKSYYDIESCEVVMKQDYLFCIGNTWSAANYWPYEYRNWGKIREATVNLPEGYEILDTDVKQYRALYNPYSWRPRFVVEYQNDISADEVVDNTHKFDLAQYHYQPAGNLNISNNTFIGYVTMTLSAKEAAATQNYEEVNWGFSFDQDPLIGGGVTGPHPGISYLKKLLNGVMEADIQAPDLADGYPFTTEVIVTSAGTSDISDVKLIVDVPDHGSVALESGSVEVEYPIGSGYVQQIDPVMEDGQYTIYLADALPGTTETDKNKLAVRFNLEPQAIFESGDQIKIVASSNTGCEGVTSVVEEAFTLNHNFEHTLLLSDEPGYNSWGFSWGDYDNDGFPDMFVTNYEVDEPNRLYHNNGDGTFSKVTMAPISTDLASSLGSSWGDYDNDGDLDIYVTNNIGFKNYLYRNNGNGTFTSILEDPSVNYLGYSHGVSWVDYDNDGFLDLFVADFFSTKFNLLYHNNGDGTFSRNTTAAVVLEAASTTSGVWADYDNDGDQDLFVANTNNENNPLYRNDGNGNFTRITSGAIVNDGGNSTSGSWGDIDNDGDFDLFVSNSGEQNNFLYLNNGDGTFTKVTSGAIVNDGGHSHGSAFSDYDNDGDLDLVVANNNTQNNFFYINLGDGTFEANDLDIGLTEYPRRRVETRNQGLNSFAVGWADIDNDGDQDLYIANHGDNDNCLLINQGGNYRNSSCLNFEGLSSNIAAIGTRIEVKANIYGEDVWQMREITGQSGGGISAQNELEQHFGLGDADVIDSLVIHWPSGYIQVETGLPVEQCLTIPEAAGATISGVAFYDENNDCILDNNERVLSNIEITIEPTGQRVITDENGAYSITLPLGDFTLTQNNSGNWIHQCNGATTNQTVSLTQYDTNYDNINFPNQTSGSCQSVDLTVAAASTALRVGFNSLLAFSITNNGTEDATNVEVSIDFGDVVLPTSATIDWVSQNNTVYNWELNDILVGQSVTIFVSTDISATAQIGDEVECIIKAVSSEVDCNEDDNLFQERMELVGAIDPNDILVDPEGPIASSQALNYKIRFQNVGTFEADRVVIENELPEGLDLSTLQLGTVSHTYRFHIRDERTLVWEFDNINLPDSLSNEPESHGFVNYRIQPKAGLENGTEIANQAAIYFDFNEPIITNIVRNTIQDEELQRGGLLRISPNPVSTQTSFEIIPRDLSLKQVQLRSVSVYNSIGQLVIREKNLSDYKYRMYQVQLPNGYYVVRVIGEDNNEYTGRMIIQR